MKILLGVTGSGDVETAVSRLVARVGETDDDLAVAVAGDEIEAVEATVRTVLADLGAEVPVHRRPGHAGSQLVELASEGGYDCLVLDGRHRSPLGKISLTTSAEFVLLNAETTVALLR